MSIQIIMKIQAPEFDHNMKGLPGLRGPRVWRNELIRAGEVPVNRSAIAVRTRTPTLCGEARFTRYKWTNGQMDILTEYIRKYE